MVSKMDGQPPTSGTSDHVVLVLPFTPALLAHPDSLLPVITHVVTHAANKSVLVLLSSPLDLALPGTSKHGQLYSHLRANPTASCAAFQRFLGKIYATLAAAQWSCGKVLMDVEVAFEGEVTSVLHPDAQVVRLEGYEDLPTALDIPPTSTVLPFTSLRSSPTVNLPPAEASSKRTVAVGGTFDHLHAAHKLLLQITLFLCTRRLIVGVMADSKLSSKSNADLVQPLDRRIEVIEGFLERRGARRKSSTSGAEVGEDDEGVIMDVVEITDPYGPTSWDPDIQALVVSHETLSGGGMVNIVRKEKGLSELEVYVVDVIAAETAKSTHTPMADGSVGSRDLTGVTDESVLKELKMGSTGIRQWIRDHPDGL